MVAKSADKLVATLLLLAALALSGCGGSNQLPVKGDVFYNGKPLATGRVRFDPDKGRPAYGEIKDGRFTLSTYKPGDGAQVGKHKVAVFSSKLADPASDDSPSVSLIPERYNLSETSDLTAEVERGNTYFRFDLTD